MITGDEAHYATPETEDVKIFDEVGMHTINTESNWSLDLKSSVEKRREYGVGGKVRHTETNPLVRRKPRREVPKVGVCLEACLKKKQLVERRRNENNRFCSG